MQSGVVYQVCWIPTDFARLGEILQLKSDDGSWVNGWIVKNVGQIVQEIPDVKKSIRNHRKNTGDSLLK
jgi:hypothetical protein